MRNNYLRLLTVASLVLLAYNGFAQEIIKLYPGAIPDSKNCAEKEVWNTGGRKTLKKVTVPTLQIFLPAKQTDAHSAIIICPGGGYGNLSIIDGDTETAKELAKYGVTAFVLKYRLVDSKCNVNNSLIALEDLQQAIYVIRKGAKKWNLDVQKVGLLGYSAGGHLAAIAATHFDEPQIQSDGISLRPDFTILAYPIISFTDSLTAKTSKSRLNLLGAKPTPEQIKWFSAELNVKPNTPPAFLIQSSDDSTSLVGNSIAYYNQLHQQKIQAKLILYQKGGHGFATYNKAEDDYWIPYAVKWLKLNLFI